MPEGDSRGIVFYTMSATPRPPLRAEARRAGRLEEVAAAPSLQRRTLMNDTKKLTRRRGGRGENQHLIIPPPRSPRLRVKLSSPRRCCTKPSPGSYNGSLIDPIPNRW